MPNTVVNIASNQAGYNYQFTGQGGTVVNGTATGTTASATLPNGNYAMVLTDPNTNAILYSSAVSTSGNTNIYAPIRSATDTSSVGVSKTPLVSGQVQSNANSIVNIINPSSKKSEEYIAPNGNFGKYFTCEDARLYVGDVFIDEGIFVQYTLQDNKIPLYGYRSRYYDAVAQGKSIVQGQIGVNFVSEGYLKTVLKEYNRLSINPPTGDQATLNGLLYTQQQLMLQPDQASVASQLAAIETQKSALVAKLGPNSITTAQAYLKQNSNSGPAPSNKDYSNAVYSDVPFDLVVQLSGANRSVTRRLEGCQLIANDQVIDSSGNTLSDGYSFIARRLR